MVRVEMLARKVRLDLVRPSRLDLLQIDLRVPAHPFLPESMPRPYIRSSRTGWVDRDPSSAWQPPHRPGGETRTRSHLASLDEPDLHPVCDVERLAIRDVVDSPVALAR